MLRSFKVAVATVITAVCAANPVAAQNYDASHQVRVGAFLQRSGLSGDAKNLQTDEQASFAFRSHGLGATAGLEWVNKAGFSWGIEFDGAAMSGRTRILGNEFGPDYLATLRLRGGRHIRPDLFLYGTIGAAALGVEGRPFGNSSLKTSDTLPGFVIGGGLEWDFGAGMLFGEYIYGSFDNVILSRSTTQFSYDPDIHAVRFGVKFKVGHDHAYDDDVSRRIGRSH
jgi:opacity protein-like surface antigen